MVPYQYLQLAFDVFRTHRNSFKKSQIQSDDLVDALCLGVTAQLSLSHGLKYLEDSANIDSHGIPVKIAYYEIPL